MQVLEKVKSSFAKTSAVVGTALIAVPVWAQEATPAALDFKPILDKIDTQTIIQGVMAVAGIMATITAVIIAVKVIQSLFKKTP